MREQMSERHRLDEHSFEFQPLQLMNIYTEQSFNTARFSLSPKEKAPVIADNERNRPTWRVQTGDVMSQHGRSTSALHTFQRGRRDPLVSKSLQIALAHLALPAMSDKIRSELLVLDRKILAIDIGYEDPRHQDADHTYDSGDDERAREPSNDSKTSNRPETKS